MASLIKSVGLCVIYDGQILAGRRRNSRTPWQMPQGTIENNETPCMAGLRELYEETGISVSAPSHEMPGWITYKVPNSDIVKIQKWFFICLDKIPLIRICQKEFNGYMWVDETFLLNNIVKFKQPVYKKVFSHLSKLSIFRKY